VPRYEDGSVPAQADDVGAGVELAITMATASSEDGKLDVQSIVCVYWDKDRAAWQPRGMFLLGLDVNAAAAAEVVVAVDSSSSSSPSLVVLEVTALCRSSHFTLFAVGAEAEDSVFREQLDGLANRFNALNSVGRCVCLCACLCMCMCACMRACDCVRSCLLVFVGVCVSVYVYVPVRACCACVCVCACACYVVSSGPKLPRVCSLTHSLVCHFCRSHNNGGDDDDDDQGNNNYHTTIHTITSATPITTATKIAGEPS
jgi:hypothetical protein